MNASGIAVVDAARAFPDRVALVVGESEYRYDDLLVASERVARFILRGRADLDEARVVLLVPPGFEYVVAQWGIWRAGGVVVPLALAHPTRELASLIEDADPELVLLHPGTAPRALPAAEACGVPWANVDDAMRVPREPASDPVGDASTNGSDLHAPKPARTEFGLHHGIPAAPAPPPEGEPGSTPDPPHLPVIHESRRAHIVYTSGTTGKPKGVVTTHGATHRQVESIARAWNITERDTVLNALPLHHVHGIVNALLCPLSQGAKVEILPGFDAKEVWRCFDRGRVSIFMGVPTMYVRMIAAWERLPRDQRTNLTLASCCLRLMISGSAALPPEVHRRWKEIATHAILERYGLTETGMVLTASLSGERAPGHVGDPFPFVQVRLRADEGHEPPPGGEGCIEVRGPGIFSEYWRRPDETAAAFTDDGWFRTGDRAVRHPEHGYRIIGRESVDIIKTGGEKISALEIEQVLLRHPRVADCAVVGVPDHEWGERVCAAVVVVPPGPIGADLRDWVKRHLAAYKAPARIMELDALPRNSMGKVLKTKVRDSFLRTSASP